MSTVIMNPLVPLNSNAFGPDRGAASEAQAEFQKVPDHKGVLAPTVFNPVAMTLYPLASLGHARAAARMGQADESHRAYEALFALWKASARIF